MNAVIYARYSSFSQTEQSIEGQLRDCYAYAERIGYKVVGEYIDRAISGRSDDRPDFQKMINDSKKKQFQYVIVYKLDRFARNRYDSAIYKHKLKLNGVRVISAMENISDSPEGIILEAVLEASAEYYSLELSQKIKRGYRESALKGQYIGGSVPIGYKVLDKRLVIDEEKAPIIQWAFEQYAKGVSKKQIIEDLNAKGIRRKDGKPYGHTAFQKALRSEKYIGIMKWKDIIVENACPALIDLETFKKVQEMLDKNKKTGAKNKAKVEYLLTGKIFCGYCGSPMLGISGKGRHGGVYHYYSCGERRRTRKCKKEHEKKDFIEWYVIEQTIEYVLQPDRIEKIADAVVAEYEKEFNNTKIKELEKRLAKVEKDINTCFELLLKSCSATLLKKSEKKIEELETQKLDIEIDLTKLKIANQIRFTKQDIISWIKSFCNGDIMDIEFRKRIIDVFINAIFLFDDKVIIYYNIKEGKQVSYIEMMENTEDILELTDETETKGVRISNANLHTKTLILSGFFIFGKTFG